MEYLEFPNNTGTRTINWEITLRGAEQPMMEKQLTWKGIFIAFAIAVTLYIAFI